MPQIGVIWLAAIVVFMVLEAATYQIISIWFAFGAIGGLIAYICGADFYVQMAVFILLSVIMLAALRPISVKLLKKQDLQTNAAGLIGKSVLITHEVNNIKGTGEGKINGMVWTIRGATDEVIPAGTAARVVKIEGVKLIAEKIGD